MGEEPMEHEDCPRNYLTGSSKAMEANSALDIILELHKKGVLVEYIVSDDDSTMRAHLKHEGTSKNAALPKDVHQPIFLCDPSHRIKVMVKDIFPLALMRDSKSEYKKIDALRLKNTLAVVLVKANYYHLISSKKQRRLQWSTCLDAINGAARTGVSLQMSTSLE